MSFEEMIILNEMELKGNIEYGRRNEPSLAWSLSFSMAYTVILS